MPHAACRMPMFFSKIGEIAYEEDCGIVIGGIFVCGDIGGRYVSGDGRGRAGICDRGRREK